MRSRLPLILIALTVLSAFVAAGCGSDDGAASKYDSPAGATQTTDPGSTGGNGTATAAAQTTLDNCLAEAEAVSDADKSAEAKENCQEEYDKISDSTAKIDQTTSDARAKCEESASTIPNEEAKANALAACAKFR